MNEQKKLKRHLRIKAIRRDLRDARKLLDDIDWQLRFDFRFDKLLWMFIGVAITGSIWFVLHLLGGSNPPPVVIDHRPVLSAATTTPPVVVTSTPIISTSTATTTILTGTGSSTATGTKK